MYKNIIVSGGTEISVGRISFDERATLIISHYCATFHLGKPLKKSYTMVWSILQSKFEVTSGNTALHCLLQTLPSFENSRLI